MTSKPMKTLKQFAETYRLKIKTDSCGDQIIPGKPRKALKQEDKNHIFEHDDGLFALYLILSSTKWTKAKSRLLEAGFVLHQDGDTEGIVLFDPDNKTVAKLAIKEAGIRSKRVLSPERIANLVESLRRSRRSSV